MVVRTWLVSRLRAVVPNRLPLQRSVASWWGVTRYGGGTVPESHRLPVDLPEQVTTLPERHIDPEVFAQGDDMELAWFPRTIGNRGTMSLALRRG